MAELPDEIWDLILDHADDPDQLKLVCKKWHESTTKSVRLQHLLRVRELRWWFNSDSYLSIPDNVIFGWAPSIH